MYNRPQNWNELIIFFPTYIVGINLHIYTDRKLMLDVVPNTINIVENKYALKRHYSYYLFIILSYYLLVIYKILHWRCHNGEKGEKILLINVTTKFHIMQKCYTFTWPLKLCGYFSCFYFIFFIFAVVLLRKSPVTT